MATGPVFDVQLHPVTGKMPFDDQIVSTIAELQASSTRVVYQGLLTYVSTGSSSQRGWYECDAVVSSSVSTWKKFGGGGSAFAPFASLEAFPVTGEANTLYNATNTGFLYRWNGATYIRIPNNELADDQLDAITAADAPDIDNPFITQSALTAQLNDLETGGVTDGYKGDITVSGSGATWTVNPGVITTNKLGGDIGTFGIDLISAMDESIGRAVLQLGTSAVLDAPASGDAASGQVVKGNDSRLTDSRPPTAHTHAASDITSGVLDTARLGAGTADGTTILYGDGVWRPAPSGGGGTYTGSASITLTGSSFSLNLGNANVWTAVQSFNGGFRAPSTGATITATRNPYDIASNMTVVTAVVTGTYSTSGATRGELQSPSSAATTGVQPGDQFKYNEYLYLFCRISTGSNGWLRIPVG